MIDYGQSYTSSWRVFRVNRDTWADGEQLTGVDSVSLTRTADGGLLESGGLEITGDFEPDYYRVVMTAEQGSESERVDVCTLLFESTGGSFDYGVNIRDIDGFSVLYPASVTTVLSGEYAPAGVNGARYAADILSASINAPVEVEGEFYLNDHIVHEIGSTVLDAVWSVLDAGNFIMQIDGRGIVHIRPKPTEVDLVIDSSNARLLKNEIQYDADVSEIPNRYIVLTDDAKAVAVNDDISSDISTVNRGYFVDIVDESPTPIDGETLAGYARRKLKEASVLNEEYSYTREYDSGINLYSIVKASLDGVEGDLRIQSQSMTLSHGITVSEKGVKEVKLWQ